jgi:hypothetical protein
VSREIQEPARIWQIDDLKDRVGRIEKERLTEREERWRKSDRRRQIWIYFAFVVLWTEIVVTIVLAIVKHAH